MKKAIILTHPLNSNYGGLLQAYALQKIVADMGYDVVTARTRAKKPTWKCVYLWAYIPLHGFLMNVMGKQRIAEDKSRHRRKYTDAFIDKYIRNIDFFKGKARPSADLADAYDVYIVGSDQVWRKQYMNLRTYFLDFLRNKPSKLKIAYAASFGVDNLEDWSQSDLRECRKLIQLFDAISVREDHGAELCKAFLDREALWVLDPTMLLNKEDYESLLPQNNKISQPSVFCYILDPGIKKTEIVRKVAERVQLSEHFFISGDFDRLSRGQECEDFVFPSVEDWLSGIRDAGFVVTDSFHGAVFSIIFNKPFVAIANRNRGCSRFTSLLKLFALEDRLISDVSELTDNHFKSIDYAEVNRIIKMQQQKSLAFLNHALNMHKL